MSKFNAEIINPFLEGTIEVFKVQANYPITPGKLTLRGVGPTPDIDIAGIIGLVSSRFKGTIALCFPKHVFLGTMSGMFGEPYAEITPDLEDGAAELLNIIYGYAKRVLNDKGHTLEKAIPTVVRGEKLHVKEVTPGPVIMLPFTGKDGDFYVEIGLSS